MQNEGRGAFVIARQGFWQMFDTTRCSTNSPTSCSTNGLMRQVVQCDKWMVRQIVRQFVRQMIQRNKLFDKRFDATSSSTNDLTRQVVQRDKWMVRQIARQVARQVVQRDKLSNVTNSPTWQVVWQPQDVRRMVRHDRLFEKCFDSTNRSTSSLTRSRISILHGLLCNTTFDSSLDRNKFKEVSLFKLLPTYI
jgi:predicted nuclease of restriction endonuclease-like (RecB) superfamily